MKECKELRDAFVEYLFDEIDEETKRRFEAHLARCSKCAAQLAEMKGTLTMMGHMRRAEPPEEFWDTYWARLSARIEQELAPRPSVSVGLLERIRHVFPTLYRPAYRWAAVVGVLIVGILIGRLFFSQRGKEPSLAQRPHSPREATFAQTVDERAERYLERSKIFLLGFVNTDPQAEGDEVSFSRQQDISEGLIQEALYLKENLSGRAQQKQRALIEELEAILLEIANLEEQEDLPHIELIRDGIDRKGILLKINIHQMKGGLGEDELDRDKGKEIALI